MKKVVLALIVVLGATLAVTGSAEARPSRSVTINMPTTSVVGQYLLVRGRAPAKAERVRIERRVGTRWVLVKRAAVRDGRYSVRIRPAQGSHRFRARVATRYSEGRTVRVVPAPAPTPSPTPTPAPIPEPEPLPDGPSDTCGVRPQKGDGSYWACTFRDDFSGSELDRSKWMPQTIFATGTQAAHACYLDSPSVISQSNGALNLTLRKLPNPVSCTFGGFTGPTEYVAGSVMTYRIFSQKYGRFEARIKNTAANVPGLHEAFWLWPDDRYSDGTIWPYAGEIDITETYSKYPTLSVPFLHYAADTLGNVLGVNTAWNCTAHRGVWNTYTLEWSASRLEILVNGNTCLVNTSGDAAFQKPYIMALTQLMGTTGNELTADTPVPATMNVDYVKVWK